MLIGVGTKCCLLFVRCSLCLASLSLCVVGGVVVGRRRCRCVLLLLCVGADAVCGCWFVGAIAVDVCHVLLWVVVCL